MKFNKQIMLAAVTGALALGFSYASANAAGIYDGVTIKWATLAPNGNVDDLNTLVEEWENETGGNIEVEILPHPGLAEKVLLDAQTGVNTYDLVTLNYPKLGLFVEAGLIQDITGYTTDSNARSADLDDFVPGLLQTYGVWGDGLYGFPLHADGRIMVYRQDVFDAHGKEPAKTWDEYLELAEYFNGKDWDNSGTVKYGAAFRFNADIIAAGRFAEVQAGVGGSLINEGWEPNIDTAESRKTMELIVKLAATGPEGNLNFGGGEYANLIRLGTVPQIVFWAGSVPSLDDPEKSEVVGLTSFAQVPGNAALLGGFGISMLSESENADAAYDFMAWFTSKQTELKRVRPNLFSVTRTSTLHDPEIIADYSWYPLLAQNLANGVALPRIPEADEMIQIIGQSSRRAAAGQMTIDDMVVDVQEGWSSLLEEAGRYNP